jgi:cobalt-zinc-cadmium efflux system outer membrane protein
MRTDRARIPGALAMAAIALSIALPSGATAAEAPDPRLRAAIERALSDNPDIEEMEHRIRASSSRVPQARALPEPMLTIGAVNVPVPGFSFRQDDMTMKMVTLEQEIPARGKRAAAARVAEAEVEMVRTMHADHVNRLVGEVADAYFDLASLDARIGILRRSLERLKGVSESVRSRYSVGQGALPDALLAGVEETKARDRLRALVAERAAVAARFNTLQNLPAGQDVEPVPLPAPDRAMPDPLIVSEAITSSPSIRQAQADVRRAEEELRLARLQRRLDLTLMSSYGQRDRRDDMVGASVGFNLPFVARRRVEARIAEKEAELSAARSRLAVARLELSRQVEEALIALASEADRSALYRGTILTQIETAARAAEEAYAVGKIDFQTYVQAVLALDEGESETIERETAIPRARAKLQAATGIGFYPHGAVEEGSHDR